VLAYPYKGYWSAADTVKERAQLEEMFQRGNCPWMIWDQDRSGAFPPIANAFSEATDMPAAALASGQAPG